MQNFFRVWVFFQQYQPKAYYVFSLIFSLISSKNFKSSPFRLTAVFLIRFRFGSVFEKSVLFGFGSVRFLEFSVGFSVFWVTKPFQLLHVWRMWNWIAPNWNIKKYFKYGSRGNLKVSIKLSNDLGTQKSQKKIQNNWITWTSIGVRKMRNFGVIWMIIATS